MKQLDTITIKGFKSIASVEKLELAPINIVIGANGSGKSNFIEVFTFLHAIREGRLQEYTSRAGGADKLLYFGSRTTPQIHIHISFNQGVNQYSITLAPSAEDRLMVLEEVVYFWDKIRYPLPYRESLKSGGLEANISQAKLKGTANYVQIHFDKWRLYHFHDTSPSAPLKKTADINDNRFFRPDGSNLAAFLYLLKTRYGEHYSLIRKSLQQVAPFFDDFLLEPLQLNPNKIRLQWRHKNSDSYFDTSSFSDGTLRFLALSTLFLQPDRFIPSVILVDEPELGLHPYAITLLASLIRQASTKCQVIVSTQSSLLLDHFEPEDILVAERVEGATQFNRLESAGLDDWLEEYSLGQLWEKNELAGRPRGE